MSRKKKDAEILNIKLESAINENSNVSVTRIVAVERFLDKCLDEYFEKPEELHKPS